MTDAERTDFIAKIKQEAEEKSAFKINQLVTACRSQGLSLVTGEHAPHDHSDSTQHFQTRVTGWDSLGRICVATEITDNPHCSSWPWLNDWLEPLEIWDWYTGRNDDRITWSIGSEVEFVWELSSWHERLGERCPAILQGPHIQYGDWIVSYRKPENRNSWITRVLNERQFILPKKEKPL